MRSSASPRSSPRRRRYRERTEFFWRDPLAGAQFQRVTDFDGAELAAAISRDGRFIAFESDRDGSFDVWLKQIGTAASP